MIPAIVLAAGASSRMGQPKALMPIGTAGETFLSHITQTLRDAGCQEIVVVIGHDVRAVQAVSAAPDVRFVENTEPERGQLSSLIAGLLAVERPDVRAVLVTLVDVPLVSSQTVRAIVHAYRQHEGALIVRPALGGRHGHPTIFDRALFDELQHADPAVGAKAVVRAHQADIVDVAVADQGAFIDIDTPAAYARYVGRRGGDTEDSLAAKGLA